MTPRYAAEPGLIFLQRRASGCAAQVVVGLKIHPELRYHPKILAEAESDVGADPPQPAPFDFARGGFGGAGLGPRK
jgi:hypothetical protein